MTTMTTTKPNPDDVDEEPAPLAAAPDRGVRPDGMVADGPALDDDDSEWAQATSKKADVDNPELAKARAKLAALARVRVTTKPG